jgi:hypothetical protein
MQFSLILMAKNNPRTNVIRCPVWTDSLCNPCYTRGEGIDCGYIAQCYGDDGYMNGDYVCANPGVLIAQAIIKYMGNT